MNYEVRFFIFRLDSEGNRKELYRNSFRIIEGTHFPFASMVDVFSRLYRGAMIEFVTTL